MLKKYMEDLYLAAARLSFSSGCRYKPLIKNKCDQCDKRAQIIIEKKTGKLEFYCTDHLPNQNPEGGIILSEYENL